MKLRCFGIRKRISVAFPRGGGMTIVPRALLMTSWFSRRTTVQSGFEVVSERWTGGRMTAPARASRATVARNRSERVRGQRRAVMNATNSRSESSNVKETIATESLSMQGAGEERRMQRHLQVFAKEAVAEEDRDLRQPCLRDDVKNREEDDEELRTARRDRHDEEIQDRRNGRQRRHALQGREEQPHRRLRRHDWRGQQNANVNRQSDQQ